MDQRSIVLCFHMMGMSAQAIHDDLAATLGDKALTDSRMTKYLRKAQFTLPHLDDSDRAILAALEEKPFSTVRELAPTTHLPLIIVH
jgi:hypothetical protein